MKYLPALCGLFLLLSNAIMAQHGSSQRIPLIGSNAPSFRAPSTNGPLSFPEDFGTSWKRISSFDVGEVLRAGINRIHVTVVAADRPAALNLALGPVVTDENWRVSIAGANPRPARLATEHPSLDPGVPGAGDGRPLSA